MILDDRAIVSLKSGEVTEEFVQEQTGRDTKSVDVVPWYWKPWRTIPISTILALALVGVIYWIIVNTKPADSSKSQTPFRGSLAVLPFKALGASGREEYLELGIADSLITKLSSISQIIVRPTSAVRKYTAEEQDALAAGREQRVDAVLEGSIQRSGDRIRVTVRLLRVLDGVPLWAYKCDEESADLFKLQDAISEQVAGVLMLKLTGQEKEQAFKWLKRGSEPEARYLTLLKVDPIVDRLRSDPRFTELLNRIGLAD